MGSADLRFAKGYMHAALTRQSEEAAAAVRTLDADTVLSTPLEDLVDQLTQRFIVNPITLHLDRRTSPGAKDAPVRVEGWSGRSVEVDGTRIEVHIPFDGDPVLLDIRASASTLNPPRFGVGKQHVVISHEGRAPLEPEQVRGAIDRTIEDIEKHLQWQRADIDPWNERLRTDLRQRLEARREKVLSDRALDAFLEVPIVERSDRARAFTIDPPRRMIPPPAVSAGSAQPGFAPEPAISDAGFAAILDELDSVSTAFQRLPQTFSTMPEESLRDVLLVVLNNRFGPASGETFSRRGKTDIFLPWGGDHRAVFIAECKWWKGPAAFRRAIDQLLAYTTWRDSHAAVILFVRDGNATEIADKAIAELRSHRLFKRSASAGGRPTFVYGNQDDDRRELNVALIVVPTVP